MPSIRTINDPQTFQLPSKWEAIANQNERIVDQNGKAVGTGYTGKRFKVLCEAQLSKACFRKRRTRALLAIIFTCGLVYCCSKKKIQSLLAQQKRLFISP